MFGSLHKQEKKEHFYYRCSAKAQRGTCSSKNLRGYDLENSVLKEIRQRVHLHYSNDEVDFVDVQNDWQGELERIEKGIVECNAKEGRLYDFIADGKGDKNKIVEKIAKIVHEREELERRKVEILGNNSIDAKEVREKVYEEVEKLNGDIFALSRDKLYTILREIVEKVYATREEVKVDMYEVE